MQSPRAATAHRTITNPQTHNSHVCTNDILLPTILSRTEKLLRGDMESHRRRRCSSRPRCRSAAPPRTGRVPGQEVTLGALQAQRRLTCAGSPQSDGKLQILSPHPAACQDLTRMLSSSDDEGTRATLATNTSYRRGGLPSHRPEGKGQLTVSKHQSHDTIATRLRRSELGASHVCDADSGCSASP